jgi:hypothetical protein
VGALLISRLAAEHPSTHLERALIPSSLRSGKIASQAINLWNSEWDESEGTYAVTTIFGDLSFSVGVVLLCTKKLHQGMPAVQFSNREPWQ